GITVVTRNSPTTFYEDRSGPSGYELALAQALADHLGLQLRVVVADSLSDVFRLLATQPGAFAAGSLPGTPQRERRLRFAEPHPPISEDVLYRRGGLKPATPADLLQGRLMVTAASSHSEHLHDWQASIVPELSWSESPELEVADLLQMVAQGSLDFTLVDSNEYRMLQAYYPTLDIAFNAADQRDIAWAFGWSRDDSLHQAANDF